MEEIRRMRGRKVLSAALSPLSQLSASTPAVPLLLDPPTSACITVRAIIYDEPAMINKHLTKVSAVRFAIIASQTMQTMVS